MTRVLAFFITACFLLSPTWVLAQMRPNNDKPAPVYSAQVVNRYKHDPTAFTQGLLFHEGRLYESTGLYGESTLREVDLTSGEVMQAVKLPARIFGEGLVFWKENLIQLTWREGAALVFDAKTLRFRHQFSYEGEGWGITHNDQYLIMSDGSAQLYFRDPATFELIKTLTVRDEGKRLKDINELEYVKGEIYANVWLTDRIARISPQSGKVIGWIDLKGLNGLSSADKLNRDNVLNGIAYDAENDRLFVTGKRWATLYEIRVNDQPISNGSPR